MTAESWMMELPHAKVCREFQEEISTSAKALGWEYAGYLPGIVTEHSKPLERGGGSGHGRGIWIAFEV